MGPGQSDVSLVRGVGESIKVKPRSVRYVLLTMLTARRAGAKLPGYLELLEQPWC